LIAKNGDLTARKAYEGYDAEASKWVAFMLAPMQT
jgi:hypothetical protein